MKYFAVLVDFFKLFIERLFFCEIEYLPDHINYFFSNHQPVDTYTLKINYFDPLNYNYPPLQLSSLAKKTFDEYVCMYKSLLRRAGALCDAYSS